ncbi:MAG: voltage-gated potassium channel [Aliidongia sp.]|jgi:voltage-gated potassium channel|nr:voltage-gated potassium channel [Aliidongia sp.]
MPSLVSLRRRVNALLDHSLPPTRASRAVGAFIVILIVINVASVILESVEQIRLGYEPTLWWIEQIATAAFTAEYLLRIWSAVDRVNGRFRHPVWGRVAYATRFFSVIDLIAILPGVLGLFGAGDLRVLRLMRLMRLLKLSRHSTTFSLLWSVFREEASAIGAILFTLMLTLIISASLMYLIEGEAQPTVFSSIPAAMWWGIETLTTVGYGDIVPVTPLGKIVGGLVSITGIGTLALFSGVLTVSFMEQLRLRRQKLRHLVDTDLATGQITQTDRRAIETMGKELGMSQVETHEIIKEEVRGHAMNCPHCGYSWLPREPVR